MPFDSHSMPLATCFVVQYSTAGGGADRFCVHFLVSRMCQVESGYNATFRGNTADALRRTLVRSPSQPPATNTPREMLRSRNLLSSTVLLMYVVYSIGRVVVRVYCIIPHSIWLILPSCCKLSREFFFARLQLLESRVI